MPQDHSDRPDHELGNREPDVGGRWAARTRWLVIIVLSLAVWGVLALLFIPLFGSASQ